METVFVSLGWVGAALEIAAFALLTAGRLRAAGSPYLAMNAAGAVALLINTAYLAAWPSAVLNLVWLSIGLGGLIQRRRTGRRQRPAAAPATENGREPLLDQEISVHPPGLEPGTH